VNIPSVLSKLFKPFMRYYGNNIGPDERMNNRLKHNAFADSVLTSEDIKTEWVMLLTWIQLSIQWRWNLWRHGSVRSVSFGSNCDKQIWHSLTVSSEAVSRPDSDDADGTFSVNLLVGRTLISSVFKPRGPTSPFHSAKSHRAWQT